MTERTRMAFDMRRYDKKEGFNTQGLVADLASIQTEAATRKPLHERVTPFMLGVNDEDNSIFDFRTKKKVIGQYATDTEIDRWETSAGNELQGILLNDPIGTFGMTFSPPGGPNNYDEGRCVLGINKEIDGARVSDSYGFPLPFNNVEHLAIARSLSDHCLKPLNIESEEHLRQIAIPIHPTDEDEMWRILEETIPLPLVWQAIRNHNVHELFEEKLEASQKIVDQLEHTLRNAQTPDDYIVAGALAERAMMAQFGQINVDRNCGLLNSALVGQQTQVFRSFSYTPQGGIQMQGMEIKGKSYSFDKYAECRVCEKKKYVGPCNICEGCEKKFD